MSWVSKIKERKKSLGKEVSAELLHEWPVYERPKEKQMQPVSIQSQS